MLPNLLKLTSLLLVISVWACSQTATENQEELVSSPALITKPGFQQILEDVDVSGSILVYDLAENTYFSNDFDWASKGYLPASTFKITNSMIGLETGVVEDDSTLFPWDGQKRALEAWEKDLVFRDAFHASCVPCYQEVARKVGPERMRHFLDTMNYGNMVVPDSMIDRFWLEGDSRISPFQQIDFLKRFFQSELPISPRTEQIMKRMLIREEHEDYKISGKTGWSIRNGNNNGWFVGFVEKKDNTYFFATNVIPKQAFDMDMFPVIRMRVTRRALEEMDILPPL